MCQELPWDAAVDTTGYTALPQQVNRLLLMDVADGHVANLSTLVHI